MDRTQLIIAIACSLLFAILVGWVLRWLYDRFNTSKPLASEEAMRRLQSTEMQLEAAQKEFSETKAQYASAYAQLEAEFNAAMDGLRSARAEASELRQRLKG